MPAPIAQPPAWQDRAAEVLSRYIQSGADPGVEQALGAADSGQAYLHWDEFRQRPVPPKWTATDLWTLIKSRRLQSFKPLPLLHSKLGEPFVLCSSDPMAAALHRVDTKEVLWKKLLQQGKALGSDVSHRLMAAIEEAHHSSAIEGAVTTRRQSRDLIRSGREPQSRSERMVLNNFYTLARLDEWIQDPLTVERICEIQATVTAGTLDDPQDEGRIRSDDDVHILDARTKDVVYTPPPARELQRRVEKLCTFANQSSSDELFLHPLTRAILMHHQLAYDHPFADGNGRTARAVFMWSLLRSGYHWFRSLSISRAVNEAKAQYYRAFQYVQSDDGDTTYFVRQQLRCIEREVDRLAMFLERRAELERWLIAKEAISEALNARQLALVDHALGHPEAGFTATEHAQYHGVTQPTAWKDLTIMVAQGLLEEGKSGRKSLYRPSGKLRRLIASRPKGT